MNRRELFAILAALSCAFAAGPAFAQADKPIRVGMTVSSTGPFAPAAQSGFRGIEIWVDDVNRRGGIEVNGVKRKVEIVKLDDRSDKTLVPKVIEALKEYGRGDIVVVAGGVIPSQDYEELKGKGVAAIFGPGTSIPVAARQILNRLLTNY